MGVETSEPASLNMLATYYNILWILTVSTLCLYDRGFAG